jgi:hypothetical protein
MECDPAPGVANVFPKPYLCWYNTPTTIKVAAAQKYVLDYIKKEGPFDGVLGFSQVTFQFDVPSSTVPITAYAMSIGFPPANTTS